MRERGSLSMHFIMMPLIGYGILFSNALKIDNHVRNYLSDLNDLEEDYTKLREEF